MSDELLPRESNVLLYATSNGKVRIEVFFQHQTVWLTLSITLLQAVIDLD